jgi:hypothetical protein
MQKFRTIEDELDVAASFQNNVKTKRAIREKLYKPNHMFVENDQSTL